MKKEKKLELIYILKINLCLVLYSVLYIIAYEFCKFSYWGSIFSVVIFVLFSCIFFVIKKPNTPDGGLSY